MSSEPDVFQDGTSSVVKLPDGTEVRITPSKVQQPEQVVLDGVQAAIDRLRLSGDFDIERRGLSTVEDVFNCLMKEVKDMKLLVACMLRSQQMFSKRLDELIKKVTEDTAGIHASDEVMYKMSSHAMKSASTFEKRLQMLTAGFLSLKARVSQQPSNEPPPVVPRLLQDYQPPPSFIPPTPTGEPQNMRQLSRVMGTNNLYDRAIDNAFPAIHARVEAALRRQNETENVAKRVADPAPPPTPTPGAGTPLGPHLSLSIEAIAQTHNATRKSIQLLVNNGGKLRARIQYCEQQHQKADDLHWKNNDESLNDLVGVGDIIKGLTPHLEKLTDEGKELSTTLPPPQSTPVFPANYTASSMAAAMYAARQRAFAAASTSAAPPARQPQTAMPKYTMTLAIGSDKPVEQMTIAELTEVVGSFPIKLTFDPRDLMHASVVVTNSTEEAMDVDPVETSKKGPETGEKEAAGAAGVVPDGQDRAPNEDTEVPQQQATSGPETHSHSTETSEEKAGDASPSVHAAGTAAPEIVQPVNATKSQKKNRRRTLKKVNRKSQVDDAQDHDSHEGGPSSPSKKRTRGAAEEAVDAPGDATQAHENGSPKKKRKV